MRKLAIIAAALGLIGLGAAGFHSVGWAKDTSRPKALPFPVQAAEVERLGEARFCGEVTVVEREARFPFVTVTLKVTKAPLGRVSPVLCEGRTIKARPFFALLQEPADTRTTAALDLASVETRLNLGAWYLAPGDAVCGEATGEIDGVVALRYLERAPVAPDEKDGAKAVKP